MTEFKPTRVYGPSPLQKIDPKSLDACIRSLGKKIRASFPDQKREFMIMFRSELQQLKKELE